MFFGHYFGIFLVFFGLFWYFLVFLTWVYFWYFFGILLVFLALVGVFWCFLVFYVRDTLNLKKPKFTGATGATLRRPGWRLSSGFLGVLLDFRRFLIKV